MELKEQIQHYTKAIILLVLSIAIGLVLMLLAFMLPTDKIYTHVEESVKVLEQETNYISLVGDTLDNYTEAIYLNEALVGSKNGLINSALSGYTYRPRNTKDTGRPVEELVAVTKDMSKSYLEPSECRFFNGYEVFLKPALIFFNYQEIRLFNIYAQMLLLGIMCYLLYRKSLSKYIVPIVLSFMLMNPATLAVCMTFSGYYYITLLACIVMLKFNDKWTQKTYFFFFEIIGCMAFYFNMNYFQLVTYGIPITLYFLLNGFPEKVETLVKTMVYFFIAWFLGFAGMMVGKWILYAILCKPNMFKMMFNHMAVRFSPTIDGTNGSRLQAIQSNVVIAIKHERWLFIELLYFAHYIHKFYKEKNLKKKIKKVHVVFLIIMCVIPIIRYVIFANHVLIHACFTYRILVIAVMAINVMLVFVDNNNVESV